MSLSETSIKNAKANPEKTVCGSNHKPSTIRRANTPVMRMEVVFTKLMSMLWKGLWSLLLPNRGISQYKLLVCLVFLSLSTILKSEVNACCRRCWSCCLKRPRNPYRANYKSSMPETPIIDQFSLLAVSLFSLFLS